LNIIASKLSVSDPENAATYFMNAAAGQAEIEAMIAEVKATLKPVQGGKFVVFHDAYQYFENDFDFYASGAISLVIPQIQVLLELKKFRREFAMRVFSVYWLNHNLKRV